MTNTISHQANAASRTWSSISVHITVSTPEHLNSVHQALKLAYTKSQQPIATTSMTRNGGRLSLPMNVHSRITTKALARTKMRRNRHQKQQAGFSSKRLIHVHERSSRHINSDEIPLNGADITPSEGTLPPPEGCPLCRININAHSGKLKWQALVGRGTNGGIVGKRQ